MGYFIGFNSLQYVKSNMTQLCFSVFIMEVNLVIWEHFSSTRVHKFRFL